MTNEMIAYIVLAICVAFLIYVVAQATKTDPVMLELEYLRESEIMAKRLRFERKTEHLKKAQHKCAASIKRTLVKKNLKNSNRKGCVK